MHKFKLLLKDFSGKTSSQVTILAFVDYQCPFTKKAYPSLHAGFTEQQNRDLGCGRLVDQVVGMAETRR